MPNALEQFDYSVISDFIGQHWASFVSFCEERDMDEAACDDLANKLEALATS